MRSWSGRSQDAEGGVQVAEHDLVVLSLGMLPGWNPESHCALGTVRMTFY